MLSFEHFKVAADMKNSESQCHIALIYEAGFGVEIDLEKAMNY
jgi:TPR repeat protein